MKKWIAGIVAGIVIAVGVALGVRAIFVDTHCPTSSTAKAETSLCGIPPTSPPSLALSGPVTTISFGGGTGLLPGDKFQKVDQIRIKVATAAGVDQVPFNPDNLLVTYLDNKQAVLLAHCSFTDPDGVEQSDDIAAAAEPGGGTPLDPDQTVQAEWCIRWSPAAGDIMAEIDDLLDPGEVAEILINIPDPVPATIDCPTSLDLCPNELFQVEIIPPDGNFGDFLRVRRRIPPSINQVMNLDWICFRPFGRTSCYRIY